MEIVVDCDFESDGYESDAQLRFCFREVHPDSSNVPSDVDLLITLTVDDWTVSFAAKYSLLDVEFFANELDRLHQTMEGKASLLDDDINPVITFGISNVGRNLIAIAGKHRRYPRLRGHGEGHEPICDAEGAAVVIAFDGLRIKRAELPGIIEQFRETVKELGAPNAEHESH